MSKRQALLVKLRSTEEGDDIDTLIEVYEELSDISDNFRGDALTAWEEAKTAVDMVQDKTSKSWKAYAYEVYNKLYSVLMNLVSNALKFTRAGVPALRQAISQSRNLLALLAGRTPGSLDGLLSSGKQSIPDPASSLAVGIPADTLRQRPDVRLAG